MMRRFFWIIILILMIGLLPGQAQDALNLPGELYVLNSDGQVQRFGLGSEGVSTVTPDGEFVLDFGVAPDANWLAYRTQSGMFMRNMFDDTLAPRQIEDERASIPLIRGEGDTIAWSPDGSALAYTTEYGGRVHFFADNVFADLTTPDLVHLAWSPDGNFLAAEASENVWWIFQRTGSSINLRAAIPGANGADWLSDNQLLYAPIEGGLVILDLSGGNQQIEILANSDSYYQPGVTREGQIVAFVGEADVANLVQIQVDENFVGTSTVIGSNTVDLSGTNWSPGGFLLTAFQGGVIALVNPITGNGFTLPVTGAAAYSWGPEYPQLVVNVPLPADAHFIATDLSGVQQVWELPADGSRAQTITPATLDITEFAMSPDGQKIVYVSNSTLFLYTPGSEEEPVELAMPGISENLTPAWSPDNTRVYYRDEQGAERGIWRVSLDSEPELFLPDEEGVIYSNPKPASGAAVMLVNRNDEVAIVDVTTAEVTPLNIVGQGAWQSGTQFIVAGETPVANGIYLGDANATENDLTLVLPLLGSFELFHYRVLDNTTLRLLVKNQIPGNVQILDIPLTGGQATVVGSAGNMVNPRLSADGNLVIGQRSPMGALLIYDLSADITRQIDVQAPIMNFVWG